MSRYLLVIVLAFAFLTSCKNTPRESSTTLKEKESLDSRALVEWNRELVAEHDRFVADFVQSLSGSWLKTETGMYYNYAESDTVLFTLGANDRVTYNYTLQLLNDSVVEQAKNSVLIDKNDLPSGFNQALKLACNYGKVNLIVPFYLAYGVSGKEGKIAPLQPVKFGFEIIDIEKR